MGRDLARAWPAAQSHFDRAAAILGYDLAESASTARPRSSIHRLQPARVLYLPASPCYSWRRTTPDVVTCQATAGLSLGEYTALVFAGVMDFETGLRVVQQRGQAMQAAADATPSGMVSILGLEPRQIEDLCSECRGRRRPASRQPTLPRQHRRLRHKAACERIAELAAAAGAMKAIPLAVAGAFHTPLMQPAVEQLPTALADVKRSSRPRSP